MKQMIIPRLGAFLGNSRKTFYKEHIAVHDISFQIGKGETVGIVGRNGSGKSTLLQLICQTLAPTSGSVEIRGRVAALLELGAGFNPDFSGRQNVFLNAAILGIPRREMEWRFEEIARFADIGDFMDQPVKTYSSGMYVRLAFATAINVDPDILIVDEALAVGDEAFQRKCFARIEQIKQNGGTVLFVSHGAQTILQLCSRAILIDGGKLLLDGDPKTVIAQYQRLINSVVGNDENVRQEIKSIAAQTERLPQAGVEANSAAVSADPLLRQEAHYDPNLVSESRVEEDSNGATIDDISILDLSGRKSNVLTKGHSYVLTYVTSFYIDAENIEFAVNIRTPQGYAISGAATSSPASSMLKFARAGEKYRVRFTWNCSLLPGVYFVNVRATGTRDGQVGNFHRITDAISLRVVSSEAQIAFGLVDIFEDIVVFKDENAIL